MVKKKETTKYSNQISVGKFIFLSIISAGIYEIVWFYRSWKFFREKEKLNISHFWRAFFAIFFVYELFWKMLEYARKVKYKEVYSPGWKAFLWVMINIMWYLPDPFWLIGIFAFLPLLAPLNAMNYYLKKTEKNSQLRTGKWWHILLIILCIMIWVQVLIILFVAK